MESLEPRSAEHISVVICTRNRPDTIMASVESVLRNDYPSFDVVVVDQSTNPTTRELLAPVMAADGRLRYRHVDQPGLSRAYNLGIRAARGDVIAGTDDDCVAPPDWLARIAAAFARDPEAGLLYGQVLLPPAGKRPAGIIPYWRISAPARYCKLEGFNFDGMGANFAVRRQIFDRIGGFDEALGGGAPLASTQDFDFAYRAFLAGGVIILRPEVHVDHYGVRSPQEWPATLRSYGIGLGGFYTKHVRCGDIRAVRLTLRHLLRCTVRDLAAPLRGRTSHRLLETRAFVAGAHRSLRFPVDRRQRLYVA